MWLDIWHNITNRDKHYVEGPMSGLIIPFRLHQLPFSEDAMM